MSFPVATIGYQAATVPAFLQALTSAGVELLIDVRAVASSRRAGFAKTALAANLETAGIDYLHIRSLGTPADGRAAARSGKHAVMREIFAEHLATHEAQEGLWRLGEIVKSGRRVALLCFEADHRECHRTLVANALAEQVPITVTHLSVG
ncbi:MAG: DUF488 domain-containing protein [Gemmatimonadota bacterium]